MENIKLYREKLTEYLITNNYHLVITLTTNNNKVSFNSIKNAVIKWNFLVDKAVYKKVNKQKRSDIFCFTEFKNNVPHCHLLLKTTDKKKIKQIINKCDIFWTQMYPSGTIKIDTIDSNRKNLAVINYCTKSLALRNNVCKFFTN